MGKGKVVTGIILEIFFSIKINLEGLELHSFACVLGRRILCSRGKNNSRIVLFCWFRARAGCGTLLRICL